MASPIEALRAITARAASTGSVDTTEWLDDWRKRPRSLAEAPGIEAAWVGWGEARDGLLELEPSCRHTVRGVAPHVVESNDDGRGVAAHRRSADRGIRATNLRRGIAPAVICTSGCPCTNLPPSYFGEKVDIELHAFLVDERIAIVGVPQARAPEMHHLLTVDRRVIANVQTYIDSIAFTSRPVLPRDRRRNLRPTLRQLRILHLMSYGLTDEKIAAELKVTSRTVRNDVRSLYVMFEVQSRFELGAAYTRWVAGG
ncbi:helix-turn-helix transcriptional regulator [Luteipulveratus flavus]|uniref:Helix-turn-helix transcriptional regulator n=1 Tax=Luteipulveratus flavus TaxID=3031728 RepID=A0ABT6C816_9MICO|nr:helix-turn-helix transcriptional regulator [Luteipulveratus sp. YIM 133296]MDF8265079.1 helix-turn-helix transcriptional regulator [Luteipulveratus sp. YIM 133296]